MLDTNTVSDAIRNPAGKAAHRILYGPDDNLALSIVVAAELRYGVERKQSSTLGERVARWLAIIPILAFERDADAHYARVRALLERRGQPISGNDLLIAAHALALGAMLVTDNIREFARVDGLLLTNWLRD